MGLVLDILHVLGAVFVIGPMTIVPMLALRAVRRKDAVQVQGLARSALGLGIGSLAVAVLGFGVMGTADPKYGLSVTTPWILWSIVLYAIAATVHLAVVVPLLRTAGRTSPDRMRAAGYGPLAATSGVVALLLVAVVILMVAHPG